MVIEGDVVDRALGDNRELEQKRKAPTVPPGRRHYADAQYFREGDQKVANCLLFRKDRVLHRLPDTKL